MDLKDYLIPVDRKRINKEFLKEGYLGNNLLADFKADLNNIDIALIGVNEFRNSYLKPVSADTYHVREYLYKLSSFPKIKIIDLGDLKLGKTVADTYIAIQELSDFFLSKGVFILLFGGTQELSISLCKSLFKLKKKAEISFIDAKIDHESIEFHSQSYLSDSILINERKIIKSIIAFQAYLSPLNIIKELSTHGYNFYRLGLLRENMALIEPVLRDSDHVSFDLGSVRQSDNPGSVLKSPNGLYAEEACQLAYLSGISDKLSSFYITELNENTDINGQSVHLVAQIIWHVLLGISSRHGDYPQGTLKKYKKIFVKTNKIKEELIFYQNEQNKRFWMEISGKNSNETEIISCSEYDYKAVCAEEIPDRLWKRISNTMH